MRFHLSTCISVAVVDLLVLSHAVDPLSPSHLFASSIMADLTPEQQAVVAQMIEAALTAERAKGAAATAGPALDSVTSRRT